MTITAAEVLSSAQTRTGRTDITAIDNELEAVLLDLSHTFPFLEASASLTVTANAVNAALPSGMRAVTAVADSSSRKLLPITFSEYQQWVNQDSAAGSTMKRWAVFNDYLYVHPKMATQQTLTIYYNYETNSTTSIAFPDRFQEAIIEGVCFKMYEMRGLLGQVPEANTHKQLYDEQKAILVSSYKERKGMA